MRTKGKHIKIDEASPISVEEMKQGEWRMTGSGLYARVGNQVLTKGWPGWAQIYDEFDDDVLDPKWAPDPAGSGSGSEVDGSLKANFTGTAESSYMGWYQDPPAGDGGIEPVPVGIPFSLAWRCFIPPLPYIPSVSGLSWDLHNYHGCNFNLWDDNINWDFMFTWCYGADINGGNMDGREPCYMARLDIDDELNPSSSTIFGSPQMVYDGKADHPIDFADQTHNGWFTMLFAKAADGTLTFDIQPDGDENWYSVTPPGLTKYNLQIGGKSVYGWGFELYMREVNQGGYDDLGISYDPYYIDWLRALDMQEYSITFTTTTTTTTT